MFNEFRNSQKPAGLEQKQSNPITIEKSADNKVIINIKDTSRNNSQTFDHLAEANIPNE